MDAKPPLTELAKIERTESNLTPPQKPPLLPYSYIPNPLPPNLYLKNGPKTANRKREPVTSFLLVVGVGRPKPLAAWPRVVTVAEPRW